MTAPNQQKIGNVAQELAPIKSPIREIVYPAQTHFSPQDLPAENKNNSKKSRYNRKSRESSRSSSFEEQSVLSISSAESDSANKRKRRKAQIPKKSKRQPDTLSDDSSTPPNPQKKGQSSGEHRASASKHKIRSSAKWKNVALQESKQDRHKPTQRNITIEELGWGEFSDSPDEPAETKDKSPAQPKRKTTRKRKSTDREVAEDQSFSPQGEPILGTFSKPRDNVVIPEMRDEIFPGEWGRTVLVDNHHFTWRNAMFSLHRNLKRNKTVILPKDLARTGMVTRMIITIILMIILADIPKKIGLCVPVLVKIANAFVKCDPPYLRCTNSKSATYIPTPAMVKLEIDENWRYRERSVDFEVQSVRTTEEGFVEVF